VEAGRGRGFGDDLSPQEYEAFSQQVLLGRDRKRCRR